MRLIDADELGVGRCSKDVLLMPWLRRGARTVRAGMMTPILMGQMTARKANV